jgi:hypothetical protein
MGCRIVWACALSYDLAEWHFRRGTIDQTEWDLYRFYWRNGAPRFSEIAIEFDLKGGK